MIANDAQAGADRATQVRPDGGRQIRSQDGPQVSVVLPVKDGAAFLAEAIDSVLGQSLDDLELIIVDDGSVDDSPTIAARAAERDPRVIVTHSSGSGVAAALNTGIALASSAWIGRLDADDVALPQRFARHLELAAGRDDVVAWAGWAEAVDVQGHPISAMYQGPLTEEEFRRQHAAGQLRPIHTTMMISRIALERVGGYDPTVDRAQDIELWDRLGELGIILTVPEVVTRVRVHADSATSRNLAGTLQVHRFVAARRRARKQGTDLTFDAFRRAEGAQGPVRSLPRRMGVAARERYRAAGVAYAAGRRWQALRCLVVATAIAPVVVLPRLWQQMTRLRREQPRQSPPVDRSVS